MDNKFNFIYIDIDFYFISYYNFKSIFYFLIIGINHEKLSRSTKQATVVLLAIAMSGFAQEADKVVSDNSLLKKDIKTSEYSDIKLNILKYAYIPTDKLLMLWSDNSYADKAMSNPAILFNDKSDDVEIKAYCQVSNGIKNFSIPCLENIEELSSGRIKEILQNEIRLVISEQLPAEIMIKVLTDMGFKRDFISDPTKTLSDFGYDLKGDYKINIYEDTATTKHLIIPNSPINLAQKSKIDSEIEYFLKNESSLLSDNQYKKIIIYNSKCNNCHKPYDTKIYIECTSLPTCQ